MMLINDGGPGAGSAVILSMSGSVAEWLKALVLKTSDGATCP